MAGIAHVITSDSASGAQVIDGSLKFDQTTKTYLTRTPGSAGNRKEWTLSYWIKLYGDGAHLFSANNDAFQFESRGTGQLLFANSGSTSSNTLSTALFRDHSQFYHVVIHHDAANTIARFYINGEQNFTATLSDADGTWNNATSHNINGRSTSIDSFSSFGMSQVYFIDGAALEPTEFGFTDPLTNTWKPKKYTGDFNIFPDIGMGGDSGQAIEVVINRQVDKAWIKKYGSSTYEGGGDPSDPSSAPSFNLPSGGSLYWFTTAYDTAHTFVLGSSSETGTQPEWASGGTTGSLTRDSATTVSGTPSSSYSSARTDALADNTVYAFTFTITTGAGGAHTGWFLSTSSSYSTGTPDEQTSGNTVGARFGGGGTGYYNYVKVYGTFATLNPNTNGQLSNRGVNSFYLPFDGNSPIGHDKSKSNPINTNFAAFLPRPAPPVINFKFENKCEPINTSAKVTRPKFNPLSLTDIGAISKPVSYTHLTLPTILLV